MSIKFISCFLPLFLTTFLAVGSRHYDCSKISSIQNFKEKMEQKVIRMKEALISKYQSLCSNQNLLQCKHKSDDLCEGTSKVTCIKNFPTPLGCLLEGTYLGNKSGIRISNSLPKNSLSDNARAFICASAQLQEVFQQIHQDNQGQFSYTYIGSSSGVARVYPSFRQDLQNNYCVGYDPRIRPWYTSTMTGQKNTIILLDISRTMTSLYPGVRFRNAINTIQIILETLTKYDHVGVVAFSKTAKVVSNLIHADEINKKNILDNISKLTTELGFTNYQSAIEKGVQLFNSTAECSQIVFLLLTDGYGDNQQFNLTKIKTIITTGLKKYGKSQENLKIISFVYGIEENINYDFIKDLTCAYNGIIMRIKDGVDNYTMIQKLSSYYAFLYQGRDENTSIPRWSEPYQDAFGFQEIISVTVLVKFKRHIIGVAAIDVLFNRLTQICQYKRQDILKILKHETQCFKSTLTKEEVQFLRCKQGNTPCQYSQTCSGLNYMQGYLPCISSINYDVFSPQPQDMKIRPNRCCYEIQTQTFAGSLGATIVLITLPFIIYLVRRKNIPIQTQQKKEKKTEEAQSEGFLNDYMLEDRDKKYEQAAKNGVAIYAEDYRLILK